MGGGPSSRRVNKALTPCAVRWISCRVAGPLGEKAAAHIREAARSMAQAKKVAMWVLVIFVIYTIITSPVRAAELVQQGFIGISDAAKAVGAFMTGLVR